MPWWGSLEVKLFSKKAGLVHGGFQFPRATSNMPHVQQHKLSDEVGSLDILFLEVGDPLDSESSLMFCLLLVQQRQLNTIPGKLQAILPEGRISSISIQLLDLGVNCCEAVLNRCWLFLHILSPQLQLVRLKVPIFQGQHFSQFCGVVPQGLKCGDLLLLF